ncbi:MAG: sodium/hydrogen exchanger [Pseudonocardiales bacterium]|nr:sodium/hydrogen exchanger [Pseudonocardiales bacterium]
MGFGTLTIIVIAGLLGPLLALPARWHIPVVIGELLAGIVLGETGTRTLHAGNSTFTFLADIGFGLVMFVAGSHVPIRDPQLRTGLRIGVIRAVAVAVLATGVGVTIAASFNTGHPALYAVLLTSSSAALVLPIVDSLGLSGGSILQMLPQVAIADAACIVALPLAIDPARAGRAAAGAAGIAACAVVLFFLLRFAERNGVRKRVHRWSEKHAFAVELRINLAILFALAALAVQTHVSIMLAGFSFGLVVGAIGEPRRLARQLFAITDGFLGPLFFLWLGASLNLRQLGEHPKFVGLGIALGVGALLCHMAMRAVGQPMAVGALAAAQLGVPVAAATLGTQLRLLQPGEAPALILGALITIAAATLAGGRLAPTPSSTANQPSSDGPITIDPTSSNSTSAKPL